ncbi:MAG TPA: helix-turn-helix domain-containing protein, partial [Bacteroidales bacterium]
MVYVTHSGENAEKLEVILKAAQKRFGLYGLEKTTMKEIASDMGMSKAALYYYFPDKEGLFKA